MTDSSADAANGESNGTCNCCRSGDERIPEVTTDSRFVEAPILEAELPEDLQVGLGRLLGEHPVETVGEWVERLRRHTGGGAIDVEELCHADGETAHRGTVVRDGGEETYYFQCFYDAVALSALLDHQVDVRTVSPGGTEIRARALATESLTVTPSDAVFSFGVDEHVQPPSGESPTPEDVYGAVCPYVRAFPDREAYERWAETVPAATVATPLTGATALAEALVA